MAGIIARQMAQKPAETNVQAAGRKSVNAMLSDILDGDKMRKRFDEILGKRTPQFLSSLTTMINGTPELQKCFFESPNSVIQSALRAAAFDLPIDPGLGYAYIVPFKNKKKGADGSVYYAYEATFILGWKGMHQLALRSGAYLKINVVDIREGELKTYNRLTEDVEVEFIEDEEKREATPVIGYLGYYRLVNGAEKTVYMTVKQIEAHEQKFRKGQYMGKGWRDDWDAMARKTIYRVLIGKWGVMSIEYQDNKAGALLAEQMRSESGEDAAGGSFVDEAAEIPETEEQAAESLQEPPADGSSENFDGAPF